MSSNTLMLVMQRRKSTAKTTISDLYLPTAQGDGWLMLMLEDVVRPDGVKVYGETAIPAGIYPIELTDSPKYQKQYGAVVRTPMLMNVPNFTGIRIHPMATAKDSEGCLGPGFKFDDKTETILGSGLAYGMLCTLIGAWIGKGGKVYIDIRDYKGA